GQGLGAFAEGVALGGRGQFGQTRPDDLGLLVIVVEALAVLADVTALFDHGGDDLLALVGDVFSAQVFAGLFGDLVRQVQGDVVVPLQRAARHAGHAAAVVDQHGRIALFQHGHAFHQEGGEAARVVEAAAVVDDDRRLPDLQ